MLASPAVRITGVFDKAVGASGLDLVYLDDDRPLLDLIRHVKKRGADKEAVEAMALLADRLVAQGTRFSPGCVFGAFVAHARAARPRSLH